MSLSVKNVIKSLYSLTLITLNAIIEYVKRRNTVEKVNNEL